MSRRNGEVYGGALAEGRANLGAAKRKEGVLRSSRESDGGDSDLVEGDDPGAECRSCYVGGGQITR